MDSLAFTAPRFIHRVRGLFNDIGVKFNGAGALRVPIACTAVALLLLTPRVSYAPRTLRVPIPGELAELYAKTEVVRRVGLSPRALARFDRGVSVENAWLLGVSHAYPHDRRCVIFIALDGHSTFQEWLRAAGYGADYDSVGRAMVSSFELLHEAGHCEYRSQEDPQITADSTQKDEAYADVRAALVLAKGAAESPAQWGVMALVVHDIAQRRKGQFSDAPSHGDGSELRRTLAWLNAAGARVASPPWTATTSVTWQFSFRNEPFRICRYHTGFVGTANGLGESFSGAGGVLPVSGHAAWRVAASQLRGSNCLSAVLPLDVQR